MRKRLKLIGDRRGIIREWDATAKAAVAKGCAAKAVSLPQEDRVTLLGTSLKTAKTDKDGGTMSKVLYLAPGFASGRNICAWSTAECRESCLGEKSGQMSMDPARNARRWKTVCRRNMPGY